MLARHYPLWANTHFNHPAEITASSMVALARLANAGIPPGNQTILLTRVNDCPRFMKTLVQKSRTGSTPTTSTNGTSPRAHPLPHPDLQEDRDRREPHRAHQRLPSRPTSSTPPRGAVGRSRWCPVSHLMDHEPSGVAELRGEITPTGNPTLTSRSSAITDAQPADST